MKKTLFAILALFAITGLFAQERIAVFPFEDRNNVYTKDELDSFYLEFSNEFRNKTDVSKFTVIPRQDIEKLIDMETKFQLDDYSSKEKTAEMQRVLNPKQILYGLIVTVGNDIRITVSLRSFPDLNILPGGTTVSITNKYQLFTKIPELVQEIQKAMAGSGESPSANSPAPAAQIYKVGDTGPAGGIVFYDRGFYGDGWRYLEAAPAGAEFTAQWGTYNQNVANTMTGIGFGKQNTQIIIDRLKALGETNKAAQLCAAREINGYKDWFLPSLDELNEMYKSLKQKGLGGFSNRRYWSSSQHSHLNALHRDFGSGDQVDFSKDSWLSVRPVRAFGAETPANKTGISIEGYTFNARNQQAIISGLRDTLQTLKLNLDIDEKTNPAAGYSFAIEITSEPFVSYGVSMIRSDVTVTFSRYGRLLCRSAPYKIVETDENRTALLIAEELKKDKAFFDKIKEAIK